MYQCIQTLYLIPLNIFEGGKAYLCQMPEGLHFNKFFNNSCHLNSSLVFSSTILKAWISVLFMFVLPVMKPTDILSMFVGHMSAHT